MSDGDCAEVTCPMPDCPVIIDDQRMLDSLETKEAREKYGSSTVLPP